MTNFLIIIGKSRIRIRIPEKRMPFVKLYSFNKKLTILLKIFISLKLDFVSRERNLIGGRSKNVSKNFNNFWKSCQILGIF